MALPTQTPGNLTTVADTSTTQGVSFGLSGLLLFVGVVIIAVVVRRKCRQESDDDDLEDVGDSSVFEGEDTVLGSMKEGRQRLEKQDSQFGIMNDEIKALVKSVSIDSRRLTMDQMLGKGQFGAVYEAKLSSDVTGSNDYGHLSHTRVAVKTLKGAGLSTDEVEAFLREGMIMKDFHHPHVLGLLGVAFGDHGVPMIVLPFMEKGNLRDYIADPDLTLTIRELLRFGHQVALGMAYLASQKFVHRDLATRNCMLDDELVVKVADFGLSRDIYTREYYASEDHSARLPVKWMALESLTKAHYSTRSDVWSFGVLLWELMTRGVTPYPDVANWDVRGYIASGRRMEKPEICPDEIYELMVKCWQEEPKERPTFEELCEFIDEILTYEGGEDENAEFYVNVEPMTP